MSPLEKGRYWRGQIFHLRRSSRSSGSQSPRFPKKRPPVGPPSAARIPRASSGPSAPRVLAWETRGSAACVAVKPRGLRGGREVPGQRRAGRGSPAEQSRGLGSRSSPGQENPRSRPGLGPEAPTDVPFPPEPAGRDSGRTPVAGQKAGPRPSGAGPAPRFLPERNKEQSRRGVRAEPPRWS